MALYNTFVYGQATYGTPDQFQQGFLAELNRLAGTTGLEAQGAANIWADTTGLDLVGALNAKAGTQGLELEGVLNRLAGTQGLGMLATLQRLEADWSAIIQWTHAWDVRDALTYTANEYSTGLKTRVHTIPDDRGTMPMRRDTGPWAALFSEVTPFPGPIWIERSARFNGRPCIRNDLIIDNGGVFDAYSVISPNSDPTDNTKWFNPTSGYAQPYWVAIFGRLHSVPGAVLDGQQGSAGTTVTVGGDSNAAAPHLWAVTTSLSDPYPASTIEQSVDETVLVIVQANGASSWIEVAKRNASGTVVVDRDPLVLANRNAKELFCGFVHGSYISAVGLKTGTASETDVERVRAWAMEHTPAASSLPTEG